MKTGVEKPSADRIQGVTDRNVLGEPHRARVVDSGGKKDRLETGGACTLDIRPGVTDVDCTPRPRADALEGDLEELRIGFSCSALAGDGHRIDGIEKLRSTELLPL